MLVHYALLLIAGGVSIYLFLTIRREVRGFETRYLSRGESYRAQIQDLAAELEAVRRDLETLDQKPAAPATRCLGASVRVQALRMIQQGEDARSIAGKLGLPRADVELLIKVHKLLADGSPQPTG